MTRWRALAVIVACGTLTMAASGFQGQDERVVTIVNVKENLYLLKGGGGQTAAFVTELGVVLVDTKLAGSGPAMMTKLRTVTKRPVTTLINTHAHRDHTGGNEFFGTAVEIIAHENTRTNMESMAAFTGDKVHYLPKMLFKERTSIGAGKDRIDLYYFGAGHTNGDAWVVFPALRVAHAGDMFAGRQAPIIDAANGGSGLAYPDSLARVAAGIKNVDTILTGHGDLMTWKDLDEYARFNRNFRDVVVSGFNHGLGISDVAEAWTLPQQYRGYAAPRDRVKANVQAIFGELTK